MILFDDGSKYKDMRPYSLPYSLAYRLRFGNLDHMHNMGYSPFTGIKLYIPTEGLRYIESIYGGKLVK